MYRIAWRSKVTGATGLSSVLYSLERAKEITDEMNSKHICLIHWPKLEPPPDPAGDLEKVDAPANP